MKQTYVDTTHFVGIAVVAGVLGIAGPLQATSVEPTIDGSKSEYESDRYKRYSEGAGRALKRRYNADADRADADKS